MRLFDLKAGMNPRRVRIFWPRRVDILRVEIDLQAGENRMTKFLTVNPMGATGPGTG